MTKTNIEHKLNLPLFKQKLGLNLTSYSWKMSSIEQALKQLSQVDDEQVKMMEERVILTDYYDNVIGHGSKKESESS